ncbi:hypothetical protein [Undibacterium sp. KW1]|uniref:hypothetical protein n=1 Tax=Undibacterium sp. KW1 TaxID=2058624 RepID=UPI001389C22C|nr:hypothetical protein [Undibacterium sp. KW1]
MTEIKITKDKNQGAFFRNIKTSLPLWLLATMIIFNILFYKSWIYPVVLIVALLISFPLIFRKRNKWGDQLIFTPERLTIMNADVVTNTITYQTLKHKNLDNKTFSCLWEVDGKRNYVIVGRESFSDDSWQKLVEAVNYLTVPATR